MKTIQKILLISVIFIVASCSSDDEKPDTLPKAEPIVLKSEFNNKLQNGNSFAFDLFKSTYQNEEEENIFISPLSVDMALSMTWNGANGATKQEMQTVLGNDGYSPEDINEYSKTLREALLKVDPSTRIAIANSIWYRQGFNIEQSFIDVNRLYYNAEIQNIDFSSPDAPKRINNWCASNTNNKMPEIVDQIPADAVMYLINAIYFKGIWAHKFDKDRTTDDLFKAENDQNQTVKMMSSSSIFPYTEDINGRYLEMPYGNDAFSMVAILPQSGKSINDVINSLASHSWNEAMDRLHNQNINLKIPRLKLECKYMMHEAILPSMGMELPFNPNTADFSKIYSDNRLYISNVIHKTFIEINEEGTEAAAATSVEMSYLSAGGGNRTTDFTVNEPFLIAIREKSTGIILFMGKIGVIKQ